MQVISFLEEYVASSFRVKVNLIEYFFHFRSLIAMFLEMSKSNNNIESGNIFFFTYFLLEYFNRNSFKDTFIFSANTITN
jgi:hypothetical protein